MLVLPPVSVTSVFAAVAVVALSAVALAFANSIRRKMRIQRLLAPVPGPKGHFLLGFLPEMIKNQDNAHDFLISVMNSYGGRTLIPWNIFQRPMICLTDPADVEHVLSTNANNWIKSDLFLASVREVFGESLLGLNHANTADGGANFRIQRKLLQRVFTTGNFKTFTESVFANYARTAVELIKQQNGKIDMHVIASQFTLQSVFDITLGVPLSSFDAGRGLKFIKSMDHVFEGVVMRLIIRPYFRHFWWCMPSEYTLKREAQVMLDLVSGIVDDRLRESPEDLAKRSDGLSIMIAKSRELEAEGEMGVKPSALVSAFAGILFAGRDTTATTLVYSFYSLARFPEEQDKILNELKSIDTNALKYDDVKNLRYLDAFVRETLRLYPPVPGNLKRAAKDDVLPDGTFVPAGTDVLYNVWYMGRHNAKLWGEDLLTFRPERWLEMEKRPSAYEYPVFQAGPRICLGMNMALLEAKLFIAVVLREFHVKIQDGEQVENRPYQYGATLMMKDGLPLQLTPRRPAAAPAS